MGTSAIIPDQIVSMPANRVIGNLTGAVADGATATKSELQTWLDLQSAAYTPSTDYVAVAGSYSNPSWLVALAWSKISSTPTTLAGYGITNAQPLDSDLTAIAALTTTAYGRDLLTKADGSSVRSYIGAGTSSFSGEFADLLNKPTTISGYGITNAYTKTEVDNLVAGLLDFKGNLDCSTNPNYPTGLKGDAYYVSVAGKVGGASGKSVDVGDVIVASADNAGGTEASVGTSWFILEHNLTGALVASNNLSDLANAATARGNLGLGTLATQNGTFSGTSSGTNTGDQTITLTGDVTGSGTGSFAATLASVNSNVGAFGSATQIPSLTVNAKGLITAVSNVTVTPALGSITGFGTGVGAALAIAVGSAGAPVLFNEALGTPTSGNLTNCTFPTLNQNTTGSAGTVDTIAGLISNGTNVTITGSGTLASPFVISASGGGGSGITSINGNTTAAQLLTVGTAGTDFNIDSVTTSGTSVFNLPDASATARGLVTTAAQTLAGAKTFTGQLSNTLGTITSSTPIIFTQTWNNSGVNFTGLHMAVTNTASSASSLMMELSVGGNSVFTVNPSGNIFADGDASIDGNIASNNSGGTATIGIRNGVGGGNRIQMLYGTGFQMASTYAVTWSPNSTNVNSPDLFLYRDAAGTLAQRNSTNAQTFRLYNTFTSATNAEWFQQSWVSNEIRLGSAVGSAGGTGRNLVLGSWNSAGTWTAAMTITAASAVVTFSNNITLASQITFNSDTAFRRTSAGVIEINNGTAGQYRDLVAGNLSLIQVASASGSPTQFTVTGAAHTTLTASTEATDVNFNLARTVQFAAGALTTQRAFRIQAPTYAFASASTITTASTLSISGAPTAGTNATITNAYALNVESGDSKFVGIVTNTAGSGASNGRIAFGNDSAGNAGVGLYLHTNYTVGFRVLGGSTPRLMLDAGSVNSFVMQGQGGVAWSSATTNASATVDLALYRDAAGTLAQRDSTNAQTFNIYGTYTSTTSLERLSIKHTATQVEIGQQKGSAGGSDRPIVLGHYGSGSTINPAITIATDDVVKIGPLSHVLSEVTITDAAVAMVANRRYVGSIAAFTADRNYTLPAGTAGDVIEVQITTGDDLYELILLGATGVSINGGTAATEWSRLFISNEFVRFRCVATNDWRVEVDRRINSRWNGYLAATVNNHYPDDTVTKVPLDTVGWNVGDIGSLSTDQVTIRRTGYYDISGGGYVSTLTLNTVQVIGFISINGTLYRGSWVTRATSGVSGAGVFGALNGFLLNAGDVVFFALYQNDNGSRNAEAASRLTNLTVTECL